MPRNPKHGHFLKRGAIKHTLNDIRLFDRDISFIRLARSRIFIPEKGLRLTALAYAIPNRTGCNGLLTLVTGLYALPLFNLLCCSCL